VVSEKR
jgi:ATP-binding cassette subfamily A (ABC1) protein 3